MTRRTTRFKALALLAILLTTTRGNPYSVQTHEEIIDLAWKNSIRPILLKRFPNLTDAQLQEAHLRLWRLRYPEPRLLPLRQRLLL
jgi:hypothetical protein